VLDEDGWFHTGDIVEYDDEWYFYVRDRKKDMFISGGENVYPVEIENVLYKHPAVHMCAVIGLPDRSGARSGWRASSSNPAQRPPPMNSWHTCRATSPATKSPGE
jgi:fatty-acyl-CoA synthase